VGDGEGYGDGLRGGVEWRGRRHGCVAC
jgi:hypothetical protein